MLLVAPRDVGVPHGFAVVVAVKNNRKEQKFVSVIDLLVVVCDVVA